MFNTDHSLRPCFMCENFIPGKVYEMQIDWTCPSCKRVNKTTMPLSLVYQGLKDATHCFETKPGEFIFCNNCTNAEDKFKFICSRWYVEGTSLLEELYKGKQVVIS